MQNWSWTSVDSSILLISLNGADNCTINAGGAAYRHILVDTLVQGAKVGAAGAGFTFVGGHPSSSDSSGGSIFVNYGTDFSVEACVFDGNYTGANGGGGAIFIASGGGWSGSIIDCQFIENHAGHSNATGTGLGSFGGGAINIRAGSRPYEISGCDFLGNYIIWVSGLDENAYMGGALCCAASDTNTTINECAFEGNCIANAPTTPTNRAADGGAIAFHEGYKGKLTDCVFVDNSATKGGAVFIWVSGGGEVLSEFSRNEFRNNVAHLQGGALRTDHGAFPIADCTFEGNSSGQFGGALYLWHTNHEMTNCLFIANQADSAGGAIWRDGTFATTGDEWENLTFAYNVADSGAAVATGLTNLSYVATSVYGSIFAFNDGPAYSVMTSGDISVNFDCCDSYGNVGGSGNGEPASGDSCFSADPDFCRADADSGIFALSDESSCLDGNHPDDRDCGLLGARGQGCYAAVFTDCYATWLDEGEPATTHAGLDTLRVGLFPDSAIALIEFSSIDLPDTATVYSAELLAEVYDSDGDLEVDLRECLKSASINQATYLVYRSGSSWTYEGGAASGVDFGSTSLGIGDGFSTLGLHSVARSAALGSWVQDVVVGTSPLETGFLFIRPATSDWVVFYGCEGSNGPILRTLSSYDED